MATKNKNRTAFAGYGKGLTKREYAAIIAMQGLLSNRDFTSCSPIEIADLTVMQVDRLFEQLETVK